VIPLDEARRIVLEGCAALPPAAVPIAAAVGLVVAEPVVAAEDVPPFANTAVDGYAVRAADTEGAPVELKVVGFLPAGAAPSVAVGPGEAVRIMTGAPLPDGVDAVVMVEDTETDGDLVRIGRAARPGDALRHAGSDIRAGSEVLAAGTVLRPPHLGVLASIGVTDVVVHRRPRVAVLSTGDELVAGGAPLQLGQIRESNKAMLLALVAASGCEVVDLGIVRDDEAALEAALLEAAASCDAIVTSGGVSMGDVDVVKLLLGRIADMRWLQIAIKPAKPFAFGRLTAGGREVPVFGLPGNPVSSFVSFEALARPGLRRLLGHRDDALDRPTVLAVADEGLRRTPDGKLHLVRVQGRFEADGRLHVRATGAQGSHQLAASAAADGLALLSDGDGVGPGGDVRVLWLA
jgi:molybdenum cofactor synthesis domain-containing protein